MRWSLFYLCTFLAVASLIEVILCAPVDTVELEARARRAKAPPKRNQGFNPNAPLKAGAFKASSKTYRNAALKSPYTYQASRGKVEKKRTPKTAPKGKDADHVLEAQTVAHALRQGGYTTQGQLGKKGMKAVRGVLNDPKNMAFVDANINRSKGQVHRTAFAGKKPKPHAVVKDYMRQTSAQGLSAAAKMDAALINAGIKGVSVEDAHRGVLHKVGIKRREYILDELD